MSEMTDEQREQAARVAIQVWASTDPAEQPFAVTEVAAFLRLLDAERAKVARVEAEANRTAAGAWDHGYQSCREGVQRFHNPHRHHDGHGACPDWCTPLTVRKPADA